MHGPGYCESMMKPPCENEHNTMRDECKMTCGLCDETGKHLISFDMSYTRKKLSNSIFHILEFSSDTNCTDTHGSDYCESMMKPPCENEHNSMRDECKKTCGLCGGTGKHLISFHTHS